MSRLSVARACSHCSCRELKLEGQNLTEIPENVGNLQYLRRLGKKQISARM